MRHHVSSLFFGAKCLPEKLDFKGHDDIIRAENHITRMFFCDRNFHSRGDDGHIWLALFISYPSTKFIQT